MHQTSTKETHVLRALGLPIVAVAMMTAILGGYSAPEAQAATAGHVGEAASNNKWIDLDPGTISNATTVASMSMNGVKYIYTLIGGEAYEAASNNGWKNLPMGTVHGATAIAVMNMNGVKYVYTLIGGQLYEAASNNGWKNLPTLALQGATAVSAINMNGVKYVYTLIGGQLYEAASNNGWKNLPTLALQGATAVSATAMNGVKYVYTLIGGAAYEAASNNKWTNLPMGTVHGAAAIAATNMNGVKYVYTLIGGEGYEAASNNKWTNLPMGTVHSASVVSAMNMNGVKYVYTVKGTAQAGSGGAAQSGSGGARPTAASIQQLFADYMKSHNNTYGAYALAPASGKPGGCTTLTAWLVGVYYPQLTYGSGDGKQVVAQMFAKNRAGTSDTPRPFAIYSVKGGVTAWGLGGNAAGHTGVVIAVNGNKVTVLETSAGLANDPLRSKISTYTLPNSNVSFFNL